MASWGAWAALIGGIISVIAQFSTTWYGALIGGVIAIIGAIGLMMN
jgi:hypothetical protein